MVQSAFMTDRRKGGKQREKTGRGEAEGRQEKPKTGSLNEFIEKRPGIGTDTPHHTTVETLTSPLCVSLSAITLSPSLSSFSPSALTLHLASSLSLTPFPPFYSFSLSSLIISLSSHFARSHPRPLPLSPFLQMNSSFSFVRLPQSVSSLDSVCVSAIGAFYISVSSLFFRLIFLLMASKIMQGSVLFSL